MNCHETSIEQYMNIRTEQNAILWILALREVFGKGLQMGCLNHT